MHDEIRFRTGLAALAMAVILLLTLTASLGGASAQDTTEGAGPAELDFPTIELTQGTIKDKLGGGDFVGLHNKDRDAMIGVLYGTTDNPNNIYLVSLYTRYIGAADVYEDGNLVASDHPIPVYTLFAQRFAGIYEFNDRDQDGMFDSRKTGENGTDILTRETVYKMMPTYTAWERSEVQVVDTGNDTREWTFSLTAKDLAYKGPFGLADKWNMRDEVLEEVTVTFHLYVSTGRATRDVPVWKVEVEEIGDGNYDITDSTPDGTRQYTGQYVDASIKYDTLIDGWDYDPWNANHALLWVTQVMFANAVTDEVQDWFKDNFLNTAGADGRMSCQTDNGTLTMDAADASGDSGELGAGADGIFTDQKPTLIRKNRLSCADNWQRIGELTWVSDVEVDGSPDEMYFQIYGALGFAFSVEGKGAAAGFLAQGGFSYPGGSKVYHDPSYTTGVFTPILDDGDNPNRRVGVILFCAVIFIIAAVVAVVAIAGLVKLSAGSRARPNGRLDEEHDTDHDYYESYYMDKKG